MAVKFPMLRTLFISTKNFKGLSRKDQMELLTIFHDTKVMLKESDEGHFSSIFKLKLIEKCPP